jgi:hypothetical protein
MTVPPPQLLPKEKGPELKGAVRSTKNKNQSSGPLPEAHNPLAPMPYPITHPTYFNAPIAPFYSPYYGHMTFPPFGVPATPMARYGRSAHPLHTPGSELIEDVDEDLTLFPPIATWLQGLDDDARRDGHNFAQYAATLEAQMFMRVLHVEKLSKEELTTICNMPIGTASMICEYARKDCNNIRKAAVDNLWASRLQPKRYD